MLKIEDSFFIFDIMNDVLVTVFIPVYNGSFYIKTAIESVLCQSFENFELLIIDDGSTDDSFQMAQSYNDQRIVLLQNEGNRGVSFTRNRAIEEAKGEFMALLDVDDVAYPMRLQKQYDFLTANPFIAACGSHAEYINDDGASIGEVLEVPTDENQLATNIVFRNPFVNSSMMFRVSILKEFGGYYSGLCEDYDLAVRINASYKMANLDEVLVQHRVHQESTSKVFRDKMISGERHVITLIHQQLGIEFEPRLIDIHHHVLNEMYEPKDMSKFITVRDYEHFFRQLRDSNRNKKIYPIENFEHLLLNRFYDTLRKSKSRTALWIFMTSDLYRWKWMSAKIFRKLFKQGLGIN